MTVCRPVDPCYIDPCGWRAVFQSLLPEGDIWRIGIGRPVFDGFWDALSEVFGEASEGLCKEWCEANPCTANRNVERWAKIWNFPTDCVALDAAKLCEWVCLLSGPHKAGSCTFIQHLLAFVGLNWFRVEFDAGCLATNDIAPEIRIIGQKRFFTNVPIFDTDETCEHEETCPTIPQVECLRRRYFPACVPVRYIAE
jgi:hypothetical protein